VVTPKESLFVDEQKKPTASVFLKTRSGMNLSPAQVEGIVHLVASAVEGLDPGQITIVDTSGRILSKRNDSSLVGQLSTSQLEYQRNLEEGYKRKIQGMLEEVLGLNKAIARVSADVDFQQVQITEEKFDPTTVLRSEQKSAERSSMVSGMKSGGEKKAEKTPEPAAAAAAKGKSRPGTDAGGKTTSPVPFQENQSDRQNEIRNYEISKVNKQIKNPVGNIKKLSVAVIVDGSYKDVAESKGGKTRQFIPRTPEEMEKFENLVKTAMGFNEERGDQLEVINLPFSLVQMEEEVKPASGIPWKEYILLAYKPAVSLVLALMFILFVVRPLLKKKNYALEGGALLTERLAPALPTESATAQPAIPAPTQKALDAREQTLQLAQGNPSRTAGIVKAWLNERE